MVSVDKNGRLEEEVFAYRITKDRKVFISEQGRQVAVISPNRAENFIEKISGVDGKAAQLMMAKITGHFKQGNERR